MIDLINSESHCHVLFSKNSKLFSYLRYSLRGLFMVIMSLNYVQNDYLNPPQTIMFAIILLKSYWQLNTF